ncbi:MAG: hypothetical protein A2V88_09320 [Elusimicrobia bacterium RBG_16_66_12]|nr:MAG: hypothetical protein A2V88_09320 [Elusimicrobia bacterium RBG_16_66_12]
MSATNRLADVLAKFLLPQLKAELIGRTIVDVVIENEDLYTIKAVVTLDDGDTLDGPKLAEYCELGGEDSIDGCEIYAGGVNIKDVRAEYGARGWEDNI